MTTSEKSTAKKWALNFVSGAFAVALALLFILVLRSIAVQITPPPEFRDEPYPDISTQAQCDETGGRWVASVPTSNREPIAQPIKENIQPYCQGPLAFERQQQIQTEDSQQTSLFVFALGGAVAVVASLMVALLHPVAPGLMIGGIVSFFIAGIHVWTLSPGIGRLITIVVIFLILVGVGLYTFREKN